MNLGPYIISSKSFCTLWVVRDLNPHNLLTWEGSGHSTWVKAQSMRSCFYEVFYLKDNHYPIICGISWNFNGIVHLSSMVYFVQLLFYIKWLQCFYWSLTFLTISQWGSEQLVKLFLYVSNLSWIIPGHTLNCVPTHHRDDLGGKLFCKVILEFQTVKSWITISHVILSLCISIKKIRLCQIHQFQAQSFLAWKNFQRTPLRLSARAKKCIEVSSLSLLSCGFSIFLCNSC